MGLSAFFIMVEVPVAQAQIVEQEIAVGECVKTEHMGQPVRLCRDNAGTLRFLPLEEEPAEPEDEAPFPASQLRLDEEQLTKFETALSTFNVADKDAASKMQTLLDQVTQFKYLLSSRSHEPSSFVERVEGLRERIAARQNQLAKQPIIRKLSSSPPLSPEQEEENARIGWTFMRAIFLLVTFVIVWARTQRLPSGWRALMVIGIGILIIHPSTVIGGMISALAYWLYFRNRAHDDRFDAKNENVLDEENFSNEALNRDAYKKFAKAAIQLHESSSRLKSFKIHFGNEFRAWEASRPFLAIYNSSRTLIITPYRYWHYIRGKLIDSGVTKEIRYEVSFQDTETRRTSHEDDAVNVTWRYAQRVDPSKPDLRHNNNYKIYIVRRYGITLALPNSHPIELPFSKNVTSLFDEIIESGRTRLHRPFSEKATRIPHEKTP
ncbi:MAG: hypothetical protein WDO70_08830 [Alphaproteobacteria bacterium]